MEEMGKREGGAERPKCIFFIIVWMRAVKEDGRCKTWGCTILLLGEIPGGSGIRLAGKYGGNGGNLSHFGNIIISPDRRADPGHAEKLSLRYVFFNTFPIFHFFNFTSTTLCNETYIFSGERWKW